MCVRVCVCVYVCVCVRVCVCVCVCGTIAAIHVQALPHTHSGAFMKCVMSGAAAGVQLFTVTHTHTHTHTHSSAPLLLQRLWPV